MAVVKVAGLRALSTAAQKWIDHGDADPLGRWMIRELDGGGVPRHLPLAEWVEALRLLNNARTVRVDGWPVEFEALQEAFFLEALRFSRPDGSGVFGPQGKPEGRRLLYHDLAERSDDPGLRTVIDWWFPSRSANERHAPPPLPAHSRDDRVLAVLRANWSKEGDFACVDHRGVSTHTNFELNGLGKTWLGPAWSSGSGTEKAGSAKLTTWISQSSADFCEWSFKIGKERLTRSVLLLRGRRVALLSELWEGPGDPGETRIEIPDGIEGEALPDLRGIALRSDRSKGSARVYPLALPKGTYATDRGSFAVDDGALLLKQAATGRRSFRTLLVSWEPLRNRQTLDWRSLTITEEGRTIGPDAAFATRVRWGRDDTLLIYRNHGKAATRAFLGHQTRARFLVGLFSKDGTVQPLLKVEEPGAREETTVQER